MKCNLPDPRLTKAPVAWTTNGTAYHEIDRNDLSEDRRPPLVLLHGGAGSWEHWVLNVDALATGFRVLAVDLPCYGDSEAVPWDTPVEDYLTTVETALREMTECATKVHFSGFSFGGFIAADMAVRFGARTGSLSMIGGAGYGKPEGRPFTLDSRKRMAERLEREPIESELLAMHRENLGKLMIWDKAKIDDWAVAMQARNVARTRFDSRRLSWADGTPSRVGQLSCPVAVIYGEHDAAAIPPIAQRFALCRAAKPDVRTELVPDSGHWAMYEAPEAINRLMLEFHGGAA